MKKTLLKFLCLSLSLVLLVSCTGNIDSSTTESTIVSTTETTTEPTQTTTSETTTEPIQTTETMTETTPPTPEYFVSPADEVKATKSFTKTSPDGIELTVTVHGYKCKSGDMDIFYIKSNEPVDVDLQVKNNSDSTIYQFYPSTPTEFPLLTSYIFNREYGGEGTLFFDQMLGFQTAIDFGKLAPGQIKVKPHTMRLSSDTVFSTSTDKFSGKILFQYGIVQEDSKTRTHDIILDFGVEIAYVP